MTHFQNQEFQRQVDALVRCTLRRAARNHPSPLVAAEVLTDIQDRPTLTRLALGNDLQILTDQILSLASREEEGDHPEATSAAVSELLSMFRITVIPSGGIEECLAFENNPHPWWDLRSLLARTAATHAIISRTACVMAIGREADCYREMLTWPEDFAERHDGRVVPMNHLDDMVDRLGFEACQWECPRVVV